MGDFNTLIIQDCTLKQNVSYLNLQFAHYLKTGKYDLLFQIQACSYIFIVIYKQIMVHCATSFFTSGLSVYSCNLYAKITTYVT